MEKNLYVVCAAWSGGRLNCLCCSLVFCLILSLRHQYCQYGNQETLYLHLFQYNSTKKFYFLISMLFILDFCSLNTGALMFMMPAGLCTAIRYRDSQTQC
jgi:hypothetical protein